MKTISNKPLTGTDVQSYAQLITFCINEPVQNGMDINEMRKKIKVLEILEQSKDCEEINLEDAEFETVKKCVNAKKWPVPHKDILNFVDHINDVA